MRLLQHILSDVRRGENIDLYVTVAVAFILTVLNLIGIAPATLFTPINVSLLGLVAIAMLVSRSKLDSLSTKLDQKRLDVLLLGNYPLSLEKDLEQATELWLIGMSLNTTVTKYYTMLERKLASGNTIKVILVNPDAPFVSLMSARRYGPVDVELDRTRIRASLKLLIELQKISPEKLEIRLIDHPLAFGAFGCNLNKSDAILYVEQYGFKTRRENIRRIVLRHEDSGWYQSINTEIHNLWDVAVKLTI